MVRLYSSDTVEKGAMRIIRNVLAIHSIQRVFMGQIDRSGVSKSLLQNRAAIIAHK